MGQESLSTGGWAPRVPKPAGDWSLGRQGRAPWDSELPGLSCQWLQSCDYPEMTITSNLRNPSSTIFNRSDTFFVIKFSYFIKTINCENGNIYNNV